MQTQTEQRKPVVRISLESMERLDDQVDQWMLLEEHWTQYNLCRRQQLDHARSLFESIKAEIRKAYKTCPAYSGAE